MPINRVQPRTIQEGYDTAQICLNGHVITAFAVSDPQHKQAFCDKCGAATTTECTRCHGPIRGYYHSSVLDMTPYPRPGFCYRCGSPYPWTEAKLKAAGDLAEELELSQPEKDQLKNSLEDLVKDTPSTNVSATRFKKLVDKAGKEARGMFREILVDVVSETAKKLLWPDR